MNVRELMRLLVECEPDAEVIIEVNRQLPPAEGLQTNLILPTRDASQGQFPSDLKGPVYGKKFIMISATSVWGISPPRRIVP
jgi:hypothetical protein